VVGKLEAFPGWLLTTVLQLAAVIGPESFPRQLQIGHPQLIAENVEVYFLQTVQPDLCCDGGHEDSKGALEFLALGFCFAFLGRVDVLFFVSG
jgi:hypothetical protein